MLVVVVRDWFVSVLVAVTFTPGTTAPEGSVMVPAKAPVPADCATKIREMLAANKKATNRDFKSANSIPLGFM